MTLHDSVFFLFICLISLAIYKLLLIANKISSKLVNWEPLGPLKLCLWEKGKYLVAKVILMMETPKRIAKN